MIGMKVFITALLAINFISPIEAIISDGEPRTRKVASWIFVALLSVGIGFTWIM